MRSISLSGALLLALSVVKNYSKCRWKFSSTCKTNSRHRETGRQTDTTRAWQNKKLNHLSIASCALKNESFVHWTSKVGCGSDSGSGRGNASGRSCVAAVNMHEQRRHVANTLTLRLGNSQQNKSDKEQSKTSNNNNNSSYAFYAKKYDRLADKTGSCLATGYSSWGLLLGVRG